MGLATEEAASGFSIGFTEATDVKPAITGQGARSKGAKKAWKTRRANHGESPFDEPHPFLRFHRAQRLRRKW